MNDDEEEVDDTSCEDDDSDSCEEVEEGALLGEVFIRPTVESLSAEYDESEVVDPEALLSESGADTDAEDVCEGEPFRVPRGCIGALGESCAERVSCVVTGPEGKQYTEMYMGEELSPGIYKIEDSRLIRIESFESFDVWED